MRRKSVVMAGALLAMGQVMVAQGGPTAAQRAQRQVQRYTILLGLSSPVEEQALTIFTTEEAAEQTIRGSERTAETTLQTAIKANNAASIASASTTLGVLHGQSTMAKATADAQFYALLTAEQQTKFVEMMGHGGGRGPGGPGDRPGGGPGGPGGPPPAM